MPPTLSIASLQAILQRRADERARPGEVGNVPVMQRLGAGAISGLFAQTATYPLHVVRRRMQVVGRPPHHREHVSTR